MLVRELLSQIPNSTKREVQDAYARFGPEVRSAVTKAIRLPLSWTDKEDGAAWSCACPVHIDKIGVPELVGRIEIDPKFELAARLQVWLASLRGFDPRAGEMLKLAQYWTVIALERLKSRVPDALAAYEALLPRQPEAYRAHLPWLDSYSPDTVAAALIRLRPTGPITYDEFCAELARLGRDRTSSDFESPSPDDWLS